MGMFTVRIELHGANEATYTALHDAMFEAGFARFIVGDDGVGYALPSAEYRSVSAVQSIEQIRDMAFEIASNFQPKLVPPRTPWVLVTEGAAAWNLLQLPK